MNWRERWYKEHGLPYEVAKLGDCGTFRCVGVSLRKLVKQEREPGADEDFEYSQENGK